MKKFIDDIIFFFSNEEQKEKLNSRIIYFVAYAFSAYLDASLFMGLASDDIFKYFLGVFGVVWTSLKTHILKKYLHQKIEREEKGIPEPAIDLKFVRLKKPNFLLIAYFLFASVSYFAAQGLMQVNILSQNIHNTSITDTNNTSQSKVTRLNGEATNLTNQINGKLADKKTAQDSFNKIEKPESWEIERQSKAMAKFDDEIKTLNESLNAKNKEIELAETARDTTKQVVQVTANNLYDVLADSIPFNKGEGTSLGKGKNISGQNIEFILGSVIGLAIEISLWVTISVKRKKNFLHKENRNNFYLYINSLFNVKGTRLTPDSIIADRTGLTLLDCRRYRNLLADIQHEERSLINLNKGGSTANFSKEDIMKIIESEIALE